MQTLRDYLARACRVLKTDYPEPELNYRQRGTTAGSACLQTWEIRLNPVLLTENGPDLYRMWFLTSWRICWFTAVSDAWRLTGGNGSG